MTRPSDGITEAHRRHPQRVGEPAARERAWRQEVEDAAVFQPQGRTILTGALSDEDHERRAYLRDLLERGPGD